MKVFVDTNIFIDILVDRKPFSYDSTMIYKMCENDIITGYIAPITINNIYYICRKVKSKSIIKEYLSNISTNFKIAMMTSKTIIKANRLKIHNYEDALQYAMALEIECNYLITRNTKDYQDVKTTKVLTPSDFLDKVG